MDVHRLPVNSNGRKVEEICRQMTFRRTRDKTAERRRLERERKKLNKSFARGRLSEETLAISQRLDRLIEQYMESP